VETMAFVYISGDTIDGILEVCRKIKGVASRKAKLSRLGSLASWRQCWAVMFAAEGGFSPILILNQTGFSPLTGTVRPKLVVIPVSRALSAGNLEA
jgi:hypothetical protein